MSTDISFCGYLLTPLLCCRWHTSGGWHSHTVPMCSSDLSCLIWCDRDGWLCMMKHCFSVLILQPSASKCRCSSTSFSIPLLIHSSLCSSSPTHQCRTLRREVWRMSFIDPKPEGAGKFTSWTFKFCPQATRLRQECYFRLYQNLFTFHLK